MSLLSVFLRWFSLILVMLGLGMTLPHFKADDPALLTPLTGCVVFFLAAFAWELADSAGREESVLSPEKENDGDPGVTESGLKKFLAEDGKEPRK